MVEGYLMLIACNACTGKSSCVAIVPQASGKANVNDLEKQDKLEVNKFLNSTTSCLNKRSPQPTKWHQISLHKLHSQYNPNIVWVNDLLEDLTGIPNPKKRQQKPKDRFSDIELMDTKGDL
jgi:hypothetical protein